MINKKRLELLTDKEKVIYNIAKSKGIDKNEFDELKERFIRSGNDVLCIVRRERRKIHGILIEEACYNGMKNYALAGKLLSGETINDFIKHRIYMRNIIKERVNETYRNFRNTDRIMQSKYLNN